MLYILVSRLNSLAFLSFSEGYIYGEKNSKSVFELKFYHAIKVRAHG